MIAISIRVIMLGTFSYLLVQLFVKHTNQQGHGSIRSFSEVLNPFT